MPAIGRCNRPQGGLLQGTQIKRPTLFEGRPFSFCRVAAVARADDGFCELFAGDTFAECFV